jgi:acyl-CoA synthetase (AMP-forming)/AMP-acid ligase II
MRHYRDRIALDGPEGVMTFGESGARIMQLARGLRGLGLETGDRVLDLQSNQNTYIETDLGISTAGLCRVALNYRLHPTDWIRIATDCTPRVLILDAKFWDDAAPVRDMVEHVILINGDAEGAVPYERFLAAESSEPLLLSVDPDALVSLNYSSGTTGNPKGAIRTHRNRMASLHNIITDFLGKVPDERSTWLHAGPVTHTSGLFVLSYYAFGARQIVQAKFEADDVVDAFPDRRVYVGGKDGDRLLNITVFELGEDSRVRRMVHAREGSIRPDIGNSRLLLHLYNAKFEQRDQKDPGNLGKIQQGISVEEGVFPLALDKFFKQFRSERRLTAYSLAELYHHLGEAVGKRRLETLVEFNRRFSTSLSCLAFALIAVPLGITAHRKETSVGFAISLVVAFGYFFFIIIANTFRGEPNAFPQLLIWLPNIIFFALGGWLFRRLARN